MTGLIRLSKAAHRLRTSYYHIHKLLLQGQLDPAELRGIHWYVSVEAVERLLTKQAETPSDS